MLREKRKLETPEEFPSSQQEVAPQDDATESSIVAFFRDNPLSVPTSRNDEETPFSQNAIQFSDDEEIITSQQTWSALETDLNALDELAESRKEPERVSKKARNSDYRKSTQKKAVIVERTPRQWIKLIKPLIDPKLHPDPVDIAFPPISHPHLFWPKQRNAFNSLTNNNSNNNNNNNDHHNNNHNWNVQFSLNSASGSDTEEFLDDDQNEDEVRSVLHNEKKVKEEKGKGKEDNRYHTKEEPSRSANETNVSNSAESLPSPVHYIVNEVYYVFRGLTHVFKNRRDIECLPHFRGN